MQPSLITTPRDEQTRQLLQRIAHIRACSRADQRVLIALAGGPGSGKSTLCARLLLGAEQAGIDDIVVVPMDGFHHPKSFLAAHDSPAEAFARRGAPFTFDVDGFLKTVEKLRTTPLSPMAESIALPGFDHAIQDPVQGQITVTASTKVVILEGNYVLLNDEPWNRIAEMADEKWYIEVPREIAKSRLINRHLQAGVEMCPAAAAARAEGNDLRNADYIASRLIEPDVTLQSL